MPAQKTSNITEIDHSQPLLHQHGSEIQKFGTLRNLPIALSPDARTESCTLVNQILADTIILYHLYKKHHWLMQSSATHE
jgi:starvation-inducible DNA-binding protein